MIFFPNRMRIAPSFAVFAFIVLITPSFADGDTLLVLPSEAKDSVAVVDSLQPIDSLHVLLLPSPDSSLKIEQLRPGKGVGANTGDIVSLHYTGWLKDGKVFDSSRERTPLDFVLGGGRVIRGWDLGIAGMKVGEIRRLHIPSELAYGNRTVGPIPANSPLDFEVELLALRAGLRPDTLQNPDSLDWKPLAPGVEYVEVDEGRGPVSRNGDQVSVHYTGWLARGTKFDSSKDRGLPLDFILGSSRVVRGFELGVLGMKTGGIRYLRIQPYLAYGAAASARIPAHSVLVFRVEVVEVHGSPAALSTGDIFPEIKNLKWADGPEGLKIHVLKTGDGKKATKGNNVSVHYTGWLLDGKRFDSSRERGQPFTFPLGGGRVIRGWDLGVEGMKTGEKRYLLVPAEIAYGQRGAGPIPPNARLLFAVELLKVQ